MGEKIDMWEKIKYLEVFEKWFTLKGKTSWGDIDLIKDFKVDKDFYVNKAITILICFDDSRIKELIKCYPKDKANIVSPVYLTSIKSFAKELNLKKPIIIDKEGKPIVFVFDKCFILICKRE